MQRGAREYAIKLQCGKAEAQYTYKLLGNHMVLNTQMSRREARSCLEDLVHHAVAARSQQPGEQPARR